ncbi:hypothetical protein ACFY7H_32250 [Streptomyces sp. NPDC012794]|uniref:hypothetical protein n=1 Tax=Streptomyces sp. NPDC012794 TaxID=3364850 RepID=UPI0036949B1F
MAGGVLVAVAVVVLACGAGGVSARGLGQPAVVGEIAVGIPLGPAFLGRVWPEGQRWVLPDEVLPSLGALGNLGLVVFAFLVALALGLYGTFVPEGVGRGEFVLFVAVALSVTAFPCWRGSSPSRVCTGRP